MSQNVCDSVKCQREANKNVRLRRTLDQFVKSIHKTGRNAESSSQATKNLYFLLQCVVEKRAGLGVRRRRCQFISVWRRRLWRRRMVGRPGL